MVWDLWGTGTSAAQVVLLVHVCSEGTSTSTTVGSVGYGTGTGTGVDMSLLLALVWAECGHWLPVEEDWRHSSSTSTGTTCPALVPEQHW